MIEIKPKEEERIHPELDIRDEPAINVMNADVFQERVAKVFNMVASVLEKSYGPYGSSTIISNYPFYHITKDGFSIMKVLAMAKDKTSIDDAIKNLIEKPCSRLNGTVGDGTTTVILAVNAIYNMYTARKKNFESMGLSPRDILRAYNQVCNDIIKNLEDEIEYIDTNDHDKMVSTIKKIAYISSNGDEEITNMVSELYGELDNPTIEISKSKTDRTIKKITRGYFYNAILKDGMYVNNDNMTGEYTDVDVLIFDHKITMNTFEYILFPLNDDCRSKGRKLVVIAPTYDDVAMRTVKRKLVNEYQSTGTANLVLTTGSMAFGINRDLTEDLAILLNTTIISMGVEDDIITKIKNKTVDSFRNILDVNNRMIPNIIVTAKDSEGKIGFTTDTGHLPESSRAFELDEDFIRVGYAGRASIGFKNGTIFDDMFYSDFSYDANVKMIENLLDETKKKGETIDTYNFQAIELQRRLYDFKMKMGSIEVGGQSGLSQDMLYDAVDDTVKATSSAFYNGITKGCSVSILRATIKTFNGYKRIDVIHKTISRMIFHGFSELYKTILRSKFDECKIDLDKDISNDYSIKDLFFDSLGNIYYEICEDDIEVDESGYNVIGDKIVDTFDIIIENSINKNQTFDITKNKFSDDIINSAKSDKEVLLATSDLISLLITGNQFIVSERQM